MLYFEIMITGNEIPDVLRCYFFGSSFGLKDDATSNGICGFAIPDLGVLYKNGCKGTLYESQYKGLLVLLKFIENNIKSLRGFEFEILTNAAVVAYQLTHHKSISHTLKDCYNMVLAYRSTIPFRISWIPDHENQALSGLLETPPLNSDIEIKFDDKKSTKGDRPGKGHLWL